MVGFYVKENQRRRQHVLRLQSAREEAATNLAHLQKTENVSGTLKPVFAIDMQRYRRYRGFSIRKKPVFYIRVFPDVPEE